MQITSKGQVTIPRDIREAMGYLPHTEVEFVVEKNRVYLKKIKGPKKRGKSLVEQMRGKATVNMSTDEILALTRGDE